jgi:hypothetical protein
MVVSMVFHLNKLRVEQVDQIGPLIEDTSGNENRQANTIVSAKRRQFARLLSTFI